MVLRETGAIPWLFGRLEPDVPDDDIDVLLLELVPVAGDDPPDHLVERLLALSLLPYVTP